MIGNEIPVLRREDLITILEELFKFSQTLNNALVRKDDGLYVLDFHKNFEEHANNTDIHPTKEQTSILKDFSIVEGELYYKGSIVSINVSNEEGNAIETHNGGIYVKDYTDHVEDETIHVSEQDRIKWNNALTEANKYAKTLVDNLVITGFQVVTELPVEETVIDANTIYFLSENDEEFKQTHYTRYIYREHKWIPLDFTMETIKLFALARDIEKIYVKKSDFHKFENYEVLDKFSVDNEGHLCFDSVNITQAYISNDALNALKLGTDGKLYVRDYTEEIRSIQRGTTLSKTIILQEECDHSGEYILLEPIEDFNFIVINYYLKPDPDEDLQPYDAKSEMIDVDNLNYLYNAHIDYMLEHDYGFSTYNSKIRFYDYKMQVTYYNHVCIYQIVGVR